MRGAEERSLSPILRSNLLTTLINNDVSLKVNAGGVRERLGQIYRMRRCLRLKQSGPEVRLRDSSIFNEEIFRPVTATSRIPLACFRMANVRIVGCGSA